MKVRKWISVLLTLLLLLSLTACGGSSATEEMSDAVYSNEAPAADMEAGLSKSESTTSDSSLPTDRKLIRTIDINAETEDLTTLLDALTQRISELDGYVEAKNLRNGSTYSSYRTRSLSMTVRIPAENADAFVQQVAEQSNIVTSSESVDDVTLQYVDTESQVKALETEQERLIALLEKAETLKEILEIEERLTDVRYELERYASRLRTLDNQVSYATINLSITEVREYTPVVEEETLWQRISGGFTQSLKDITEGFTDLLVWVIVNSPYLLIWCVIIGAVILIIRRKWKPRVKKATPPEKPE